jgi:hypothetical protein
MIWYVRMSVRYVGAQLLPVQPELDLCHAIHACCLFLLTNLPSIERRWTMVMVTLMLHGHVILIPVVVADRDNVGPSPIRWSHDLLRSVALTPVLGLS